MADLFSSIQRPLAAHEPPNDGTPRRADAAPRLDDDSDGARWLDAMEAMGDGVWDWDAQTNRVAYSPQWNAMLGYAPGEIGEALDERECRIHHDDRQRVHTLLQRHLDGHAPMYASEHRMRCKDGSYKWILDRGKVVSRTPDGRPLRVLGIQLDIIACKEAERAMAAERDMLRAVIDNMGQGLTVTDAQRRFELVNPAYARLFGYDPRELIGKRPSDVTVAEDHAMLDRERAARLRGETTTYESRLVRADGTVAPVLVTGVPRWKDNAFSGAIAVITDLTDIKRAERDLRDSEERFRQFVEQSVDGVAMLDEEGRVIEWNAALAAMTGLPRAEAMGRRFEELHDLFTPDSPGRPETIRRQADTVAAALTTGLPPYIHTPITFAPSASGGQLRCLQQIAFTIRTQHGYRLGILTRDVTEQKMAERLVAAERNLLRTVIDNLPDEVFAKDIDGRYTLTNRVGAQAAGVANPDCLVGKTDFDLFPAETAAAFRAEDQTVMLTGAPLRREEPSQAADGRQRWIMTSKVPWRDADGQIIGVVGVSSDITDRIHMEQELRRVNDQLQTRYDELRDLHAQLREQALRDPVTQLYNRRYLNDVLPREIARTLRQGTGMGLMMIDIDHFKLLNDTLGHAAGDDTLQALARQVQTRLRPGDIACRYGGDEILCLLPDTTLDQAALLAERVRAAICRQSVIPARPGACVTVSIGVAAAPLHGSDMTAVLNAVDEALYCAKAGGRNCVRVAPAAQAP